MNKPFIIGLVLLFSVLLAACSNTNNSADNANNSTEEKPETAEEQKDSSSYYTANESGSISIIDATTNEVVDTIKEDGTIHNVQISPDGKLLGAVLVPSMGGHSGHGDMKMNGFALFYDVNTKEQLHKVEVGAHPAHIVFSHDNKYILVTNNENNTISVIDTSTFKVAKTIDTGKGPHGFRISKDSKSAYIANMGENTVSVVDLTEMKETKKIEVGNAPVTTGVTSDGQTLVATLNAEDALAIVNLANDQVEKIPVGNGPAQVFIGPDDKFAFVANQGTEENPSSTVTKVNLETRKVEATIEVGKGPHGVVTSDNGKFTYVTNMFDDTVSVIDNATNKVTATVKVEKTPNGITSK